MTTVHLVGFLLLFLFLAIFFVFFHLMIGKLIRPSKMNPEKATIYECGEPTIGSAWIQFDLRFYVIALLFVVFDVEVAFFFPWAVVFGQSSNIANTELPVTQREDAFKAIVPAGEGHAFATEEARDAAAATQAADPGVKDAARTFGLVAFLEVLVFFGVLLVGFAYLWKRGDLVWVRSTAAEDTGVAADRAAVEEALGPGGQVPAGTAS
jgi:NADH-quinone oxidoreductase subunit A